MKERTDTKILYTCVISKQVRGRGDEDKHTEKSMSGRLEMQWGGRRTVRALKLLLMLAGIRLDSNIKVQKKTFTVKT